VSPAVKQRTVFVLPFRLLTLDGTDHDAGDELTVPAAVADTLIGQGVVADLADRPPAPPAAEVETVTLPEDDD
jgi:hypothetical protein